MLARADPLASTAAFTASVTWAFASTRYAQAAQDAGSVRVNLVRALSASALWLAALCLNEGASALLAIDLEHALMLAGSIACSYAIGDSVFYAAASRAGVSVALAVATIYPLWAALYGAFARAEPFGLFRVLGLLGCVGGVAALLAQTRAGSRVERAAGLAGVGLALLTSLFWAGNAVFLKLGSEGLSLYQANALRFSFGALLLWLQLPLKRRREAALVPERPRAPLVPLLRRLWLPLLADTGLGSVAFVYGITHTDLALGATLSSLSPLVALPLAVALGSERVTPGKVLAVTITVAGVVLLVTAPR